MISAQRISGHKNLGKCYTTAKKLKGNITGKYKCKNIVKN